MSVPGEKVFGRLAIKDMSVLLSVFGDKSSFIGRWEFAKMRVKGLY